MIAFPSMSSSSNSLFSSDYVSGASDDTQYNTDDSLDWYEPDVEPLFNLFAQFREYRREDQQPLFPHDQLKRDHNRAVRFTEQWGLKHRLAKEELEFCMDPEKRIRARSRRICGATAVEKNASENLENYQELKQTTERALRAWEHTHREIGILLPNN